MERKAIHVNQIKAKANSKKEMVRILQLEGDVYMPPLSQANHSYVAGVLCAEKKVTIFINF